MANLIAKSTLTAPRQVGGGGGSYDKTKDLLTGGQWPKEEHEYRINVLDLRAILLGLKALCGSIIL